MQSREQSNYTNERPTSHKSSSDDGPVYLLPVTFFICFLTIIHVAARVYLVRETKFNLTVLSRRYTLAVSVVFLLIVIMPVIGYALGTGIMRIPMMLISCIAPGFYIHTVASEVAYVSQANWVRFYDFGICAGLALLHIAYILLSLGSWRYKYSNIKKTARMKPLILTFNPDTNHL